MKDFFYIKNIKVPVKVPVNYLKKLFSTPKLFIPKIKETGKPNIDKSWYVYYFFRNPHTGLLEKYVEKQGINRLKTISKRTEAGNNLRKATLRFLQEGGNPWEIKKFKEDLVNKKKFSVAEAFDIAFKEKCKVWGQTSKDVNNTQYNVFLKWLTSNNLIKLNIKELSKRHIVIFLNELTDQSGRANSNTTRNNYRRLISSLVSQMVHDDILDFNFVLAIPKLKSVAQKNQPFTLKQLNSIKEYLIENDKYLYTFMKFVMYALMRNVEICRLQVKDIDLDNNIIKVKTKTEDSATILIIPRLKEVLLKMELDKYNPTDFLFTKNKTPGTWEVEKERSKVNFFSRRFEKMRKAIGKKNNLNKNHNIYSGRHTTALDLFNSFKNQGLTDLESKHRLMTITRHKSISGLENYLRDIGASLPKDYSDDYTLNF
ncbi:site-specific integrase [Tenacibaculum ovolyticum]|uniref:tyrosine-type recombinase/integrase n=1 Tax=Tenacibaculum ovolyticum TaxID=104270 RepID=UPI0022F39055|nr:site-specific integrase [Tenacibaculum ovolyticum]WBX78372.1 site-specific integrase [Tenacibaculum ovolyticum]